MPDNCFVRRYLLSVVVATAAIHSINCIGNYKGNASQWKNTVSGDSNNAAPQSNSFEPQPVRSYVSKVKNILVGLPPTADEINSVATDPNALRSLVRTWIQTPQYQAKMLQFFASAFQQTQVNAIDFTNQTNQSVALGTYASNNMLQNMRESFARTALELIAEGQPFSSTLTTRRFMMTVPMMVFYGFVDQRSTTDAGRTTPLVLQNNPNFTVRFEAAAGPIPVAKSINPADPDYMLWYLPRLATPPSNANCQWTDPLVITPQVLTPERWGPMTTLFNYLVSNQVQFVSLKTNTTCGPVSSYDPNNALITMGDYNQWRMITIRTPNPNEPTTLFWDLPTLRTTSELVLRVPRVGFFTTPAFFAGWQTNSSNQARVTLNQTMIAGLNHAMDGTLSMVPPSEAAVDASHAPPNSPCFTCHQTLDPMRQFFRHDYSLFFSVQQDPNELQLPGQFAFDGVSATGRSITDLAQQMAEHPRFALAWAQKLCTFASSAVCLETDPELQRIAGVFAASNYDWNTLVEEVFSSPLVTYASPTLTARSSGVTLPVVTRERLCAVLANRLGLTDPCGLSAGTSQPATLRFVHTIVQVFPSLQYARGAVTPVMANNPSLFFTAGMENICGEVANAVVDAGTGSRYVSTDPNTAITDLVHNLMGVPPGDDTVPLSILQDNFNASRQDGATATDALKNTFVLACMAPSTIALGL